MKKKIFIILSVTILLVAIFFFFNKWSINIYMESLALPPLDKIDMKVTIDDKIVFNDTLQQNLGGYPTHIKHAIRIGYHTVNVYSNQADIHEVKKLFLFFNHYLLVYYSFDQKNDRPVIYIDKGQGQFRFE